MGLVWIDDYLDLTQETSISKIEWWLDCVFPFLYHYSLLVFQSWLLNQKNITCATRRTKWRIYLVETNR